MKEAAAARTISINVNGEGRSAIAEPRVTPVDFLRRGLRLTGTHVGCEHGVCGACTVLVDEFAVRGCLILAVQAQVRQVQTVKSLGTAEAPHPLQRAFSKHYALQCGYCTPGMPLSLVEFLQDVPDSTALSGNLCRRTGYQNIIKAALEAAAELRRVGGKN
jgi:aerobic-type carbon monoxide dehydrogenase small subunit (CoxS/CutS family)